VSASATPAAETSIGSFELAGGARYGMAILAYSVALPLLLLVPPALKGQSGFAPGFTWQEVVDLFTPVVLLPLFALALALGSRSGRAALLALVVIAAVWVSGQAMHLAANAAGDAAVEFGAATYAGSVPGQLSGWIDEVLSHWLWHGAWVALLLLLAWSTAPSRATGGSAEGATAATVGGAIQGFTWFVVTVEGVTAALGIPAAILFVGLGLLNRHAHGTPRVTAAFLLATGAVALLGYGVWAAINLGTLPEFTHWVPPW
jgi:hypothetical protein